jgi:hypothetical protein
MKIAWLIYIINLLHYKLLGQDFGLGKRYCAAQPLIIDNFMLLILTEDTICDNIHAEKKTYQNQ